MAGTIRFEEDLRVAVEAAQELGTPLALVVARASARSRRGRRRAEQCLRSADGFVYDLGDDCWAIVLPGSHGWSAFTWALDQRRALRRCRATITCGAACLAPGESAQDLRRRATAAIENAIAEGAPAWLERTPSRLPVSNRTRNRFVTGLTISPSDG
jgi:hypothetical protein